MKIFAALLPAFAFRISSALMPAAAFLCASVSYSAAQDSSGEALSGPGNDDSSRAEVLTTSIHVATKTPKAPADLSPSVDYVSGGELQIRQIYSLEDVLSYLPGTSLVQAGQAGAQTSLFIRGMESNHAVVTLNGRRLAPGLTGLYSLELLDTTYLDSVQLVRGPVSSLYGSDALAGALELGVTDARYLPEGAETRLFAEGGSFSTYRFGTKMTAKEGPVGGVFDLSYFDTDNDRPNSDFQNLNLRTNMAVEIADGVFFDLLGYYQQSGLGVPGSSLSAGFPDLQRNDNESWLLSPRLSFENEDWNGQVFYSYNESTLEATRDPFFSDNRLEQTAHEVEGRLNYTGLDGTVLTAGAGYYQYEFARIPLIPGAFNTPASKEYSYASVFGQADVDLPADFNLLVSGRWDEHDSFESKGTYSFQLSKEIEPTGTQLFAKYATGYKAPSGQDFVYLDPSVDPDTIAPEESRTWELGIRQYLPEGLGSVSLVYFNTEVDNLVDSIGYPAFPTEVDTEMDGFELGLDLKPCRGLTLYANYTYLDAVVADGLYFGGFGGGPGDRLIRRPRHTLGAGVIYQHGTDWTLGAEVRGAYDRLDSPGVTLGDYTVARVYGSLYLTDRLELFARIENVFDEEYETTEGFEARGFGAFGGVRLTF